MTDSMKLRNIVESSGLKKTFIAKELGLSYQGYLNKESGRRQFNANEIKESPLQDYPDILRPWFPYTPP
jgi:DNA-binding XRE family transcriptional regulator